MSLVVSTHNFRKVTRHSKMPLLPPRDVERVSSERDLNKRGGGGNCSVACSKNLSNYFNKTLNTNLNCLAV